MGVITKEELVDAIQRIRDIKQLIDEQRSKEETVQYLMQETGLPREECEGAYDFYSNLQLP